MEENKEVQGEALETINKLKEENEKLKNEVKKKTVRDKMYGRITLTKKQMDIIIGVLIAIFLILLVVGIIF